VDVALAQFGKGVDEILVLVEHRDVLARQGERKRDGREDEQRAECERDERPRDRDPKLGAGRGEHP
jgi:hypothetical protein